MAALRKLFYALALVALIAGITVPASAQTPLSCSTQFSSPPTVRAQGLTELVGDILITCTGGTATASGNVIPAVNISVILNTNITSKITAAIGNTNFSEALLLVDEPSSGVFSPARNSTVTNPLLNCGAAGTVDSSSSGPGICADVATTASADAYNGASSGQGTYGAAMSAHPNVFQGRQASTIVGNQNQVVFLGVPFEAPGTLAVRTFRITNIRANAAFLGASTTNIAQTIQAQISITNIGLGNPTQIVAYTQNGLNVTVQSTSGQTYLQCAPGGINYLSIAFAIALGNTPTVSATSVTTTAGVNTYAMTTGLTGYNQSIRFQEGIPTAFKAKNLAQVVNNGSVTAGQYPPYSPTQGLNYPADLNQNIVGGTYFTETGFSNQASVNYTSGTAIPGIAPAVPTASNVAFASSANGNTGIVNAGTVSTGTRLAATITGIPAGSYAMIPSYVFLYRANTLSSLSPTTDGIARSLGVNGTPTGVAVLVASPNADGSGGSIRIGATGSGSATANTLVQVPSTGLVVYEIEMSDPANYENFDVPVVVSYIGNLASNQPTPGVFATAQGGFAPFYTVSAASNATQMASPATATTFPLPRFVTSFAPATAGNLFVINKCACNLLFPYVVSTGAGGYDTGIAIANTTLDPSGGSALNLFGYNATPAQSGPVQLWYYGTTTTGGAPPATQCTNATTPGSCTGTLATVPAGQVLTYVASQGGGVANSTTQLLDNRANNFVGYVIAQSGFQYCHAFAYISATGAGPLTPGTSEGYLGLVLDNSTANTLTARTTSAGENLVH